MSHRGLVFCVQNLVTVLVLSAAAAVVHFWPPWFWLEVRSVRVFDAVEGEPIPMVVDRTVHRTFRGSWIVTLRETNGSPSCIATGTAVYLAGSPLPAPLTLKWWTHPNCYPVTPGTYVAQSCWVVTGLGLLPDKDAPCVDSNIFRIVPKE